MDCRYPSEGDGFTEQFGGCQVLRSAVRMWLVQRMVACKCSQGLIFNSSTF